MSLRSILAHEGLLKTSGESFEDSVKGKKFRNPETENDVAFGSLPADEQKKLRGEWDKKNKGGGKGVPDHLKKDVDTFIEDFESRIKHWDKFYRDEKGLPHAKKMVEAFKKGDLDEAKKHAEALDKTDPGIVNNSMWSVLKDRRSISRRSSMELSRAAKEGLTSFLRKDSSSKIELRGGGKRVFVLRKWRPMSDPKPADFELKTGSGQGQVFEEAEAAFKAAQTHLGVIDDYQIYR